jgi:hypothetical protein
MPWTGKADILGPERGRPRHEGGNMTETGPNWTLVYECWDETEAKVVESYLKANDIHATTSAEMPHDVFPMNVNGQGRVGVLVDAGDVEEAKRLIASRPEGSGESAE